MSMENKSKVHKLSLKGSSKLVAEFFEYSINTILFQRGVYPAEDFTPVKKYGLNMLVSCDDQVKAYIKKIMSQLNKWMIGGKISKLVIVITSKETGEHVERWQFDVQLFNKPGKKMSSRESGDKENAAHEDAEPAPEKTEKEIHNEIQSIFRQITASVTFLPQLDGNCTFNVLVYANADSDVPLEWGDSDAKEIKDAEKVQLRSFSTSDHKVETLVSYRSRKPTIDAPKPGHDLKAPDPLFTRSQCFPLPAAAAMKVAILLGQPIPRLSLLSRSIISSPRGIAAILFISAYLIAILYCRQAFYRDPTSAFFDATRGYEKSYSLEREHQAEEYIQAANRLIQPHTASAEPVLCLGVATVSRPSKQYIRKTIGSLLADLTELERRKIHFILFIAHTDPHVHPIYGEKWVQTLPNTLLSYEANATELSRIKKWEDDKDYMPKGLYDYAYLLENCYKTGAPYIAMVEGDVLAVEGWFPRAIAAAEAVEDQAPWGGDTGSWLYIRMFFTETYMGWNREEWPRYLMWSILLLIVVNVCLVGARAVSPMFQRTNSNSTLVVVSFVCLPACILLYFFAGRISMQPLAPGVRPMENFGCCSQGFIFLRRMVPHILDRIRHPLAGYIDMLMEAVAETDKLGRWAIFPSLLQHIGGQSSKGDEVADSRAKMIWNFGFEMYKAATLRTGQ